MPFPFRLFTTSLCLMLVACTPPQGSRPPSQQADPSFESRPSQSARGRRSEERHPRGAADSRAGFDFYLLNLSWSPEFCVTHPTQPECARHLGFVLHGLWPQNADGTYPQHCSEDPPPSNPADFRDLYPDAGLLRHEWQTHGTCSGLAPERYFETARQAVQEVRIPQQLSGLDHQTSMSPDAILSLFTAANPSLGRESLALSCGNNYLTAVEVCLGMDLHPVACQQVRSCRANSVRIPPPAAP